LLTTLFVSQGTPLLLGGDEMNRSQRGNNNGYCQDNPLTWHDWRRTERQRSLVAYVKRLIEFRQHHPVLKRRTWLSGQPDPEGRTDVTWYNVWGLPMTQEEWTSASVRCVGVLLDGRCCDVQNDQGQKIVCDSVLLLINASHEKTTFTLPSVPGLKKPPLDWTPRIDSAKPDGVPAVCGSEGGEESQIKPWKSGEQHTLLAHSMVVLSQPCVS
jgi:glycogen operon protein